MKIDTATVKVVATVSGAIIGVLLARWLDEVRLSQALGRSEHDKHHYARGLAPLPQPPIIKEQELRRDYGTDNDL